MQGWTVAISGRDAGYFGAFSMYSRRPVQNRYIISVNKKN